jgi:LPXTG-site transpeptidase (sortase) family protein
MKSFAGWREKLAPDVPQEPYVLLGWLLSHALFGLAAVLFLAATLYGGYALLNAWLAGQDRYLVADEVAGPFAPLVPGASLTGSEAMAQSPSGGAPLPGTPPSTLQPPPGAASAPVEPPAVSPSGSGATSASAAPPVSTQSGSSAPPAMPGAARIRIPAIGVDRAVIELPRTRDPRTGAWTRDVTVLFRSGRNDLVGHWGGSAFPGEPGNTILVGHNYGYGSNGVFLRLGNLRAGQEVIVINDSGDTFTYAVRSVESVPWRRKDEDELLQHTELLAFGGPERLTLVTCGGSTRAPFPTRVYVVADPVGGRP